MTPKLAFAGTAWACTLVMLAALFFEVVPLDLKRGVIAALCFIVAIFASALASERQERRKGR